MTWRLQLTRYAIVGIANNLIGYLIYLAMTGLGVEYKLAMTLLYAIGVLQTFVFNKRWSFKHEGETRSALFRYIAAYAFGYILNLSVLVVMVDMAGFPHQWVQGFMILALAGMLFLLQRYWVFRPAPERTVTNDVP